MRRSWLIGVTLVLFSATGVRAEVSLPSFFTDHMVLQRERPIHIWGQSASNEVVTVEFNGQKASATANRLGLWSVYFSPMKAGGPFALIVRSTNTIEIKDILLGDIWIASGQSNMEMPLGGWDDAPVTGSAEALAKANYPRIRLLLVERESSYFPLSDLKKSSAWKVCNPDSAKEFSAVAFFFGRDIYEKTKVPIGLIDASWGGTPAEAWTSWEGLGSDAALMPMIAARGQDMAREELTRRELQLDYQERLKTDPNAKLSWHAAPESWAPAGLYNAMIAPFTPMAIRGAIWYQGESNAGQARAPLYGRLFSDMISDWRRHWGIGDFPFLFVQLASFGADPGDGWQLVREGQRQTLQLVNTGMAVAIDVGSEKNIHPADKGAVGSRLALWARSISYAENIEVSGPLFRQANPWNGGMQVWFDHAKGLIAKDGALAEFEVAGDDGKFSTADASIEGETVIARSPMVPNPKYVRYAWKSFAGDANLYNAAGLPASPFTSMVFPPPQD